MILLETEKIDSTLLILKSTNWFAAGVLLYGLLTLLKVHIDWYLQGMIYNGQVNPDRPFQNYLRHFLTALGTSTIYKNAFKYLWKYKTYDSLGKPGAPASNVKVGNVLKFLTGLTTFLNPYIVISFAWIFIGFWIGSKFLYDPLRITLGAIQQKLDFIESIAAVELMAKNKSLVIFIYGLLCLFFPFAFSSGKYKRWGRGLLNYTLVTIAIVAHLSFFGAMEGGQLPGERQNLKELQEAITNIHNEIYVKGATLLAIHEEAQQVNERDASASAAIKDIGNLDSIAASANVLDVIRPQLKDALTAFKSKEQYTYTLQHFFDHWHSDTYVNHVPGGPPSAPPSPGSPTSANSDNKAQPQSGNSTDYSTSRNYSTDEKTPAQAAETFIKSHEQQLKDAVSDNYLGNEENWNISEGTTIVAEINEAIEQEPLKNSRGARFFTEFFNPSFEYMFDKGIDVMMYYMGGENQELIKQVLSSLLSDEARTKLISGINQLVSGFRIKKVKDLATGIFSLSPESWDKEVLVKTNEEFINAKKAEAVNRSKALANQLAEEARAKAAAEAAAKLEEQQASNYLASIRSADPWEGFRRKFRSDYRARAEFSNSQLQGFDKALDQWDDYCEAYKLEWYRDRVRLEPKFLDFMKSNPDLAGAWGFIIQQEDWNGAVIYFSEIAPERGVTGKPYNMLRYYLKTNHFSVDISEIYTDQTNNAVAKFCPH